MPPVDRRSLIQSAMLMTGLAALPGPIHATVAATGFTHCVASGDPRQDSVVLWTRFVPIDRGTAGLRVEVAEDPAFRRIAARGTARSGPATDHCAHVVADGLAPGRWYHYRFIAPDGTRSPTGRTRTLPANGVDAFRIAVFSCANATTGWFNAYAHAARREDIDLLVHLGDYIYESPNDRSDALPALALARDIRPTGEAVTLADYRLRYASYRADPDLQELHRLFPMVAMWDDHETANNAWSGGAANHDATTEGPWPVRAAAGVRAFREWLPMRGDDYAACRVGDLATLFRLETRLLARSEQLDPAAALRIAANPATAIAAFRDGPLADPARTMMGGAQERWLADAMARSVRDGTRWQLLLQQVIMAPLMLPRVTPAWYAPGQAPTPRDAAGLDLAAALGRAGVPTSLDRWDGYPAARMRLYDAARQAGANLVVLSGDSHNAWASDLADCDGRVGVEFAGHSVSSLGMEKRFGGDAAGIATDFVAANPTLRWCDTSRRGYMVVDLHHDRTEAAWAFVASRSRRGIVETPTVRQVVEHGRRRIA